MYGDINFAPYYMHSVLEMKCQTLGPSFASNLKKTGWDSKRLEQI